MYLKPDPNFKNLIEIVEGLWPDIQAGKVLRKSVKGYIGEVVVGLEALSGHIGAVPRSVYHLNPVTAKNSPVDLIAGVSPWQVKTQVMFRKHFGFSISANEPAFSNAMEADRLFFVQVPDEGTVIRIHEWTHEIECLTFHVRKQDQSKSVVFPREACKLVSEVSSIELAEWLRKLK